MLAPCWPLEYLVIMHFIPSYPESTPLELSHAAELQPYLLKNRHGISEFSMASLYPFTQKRHYTVSSYTDGQGNPAFMVRGLQWIDGKEEIFAMLPSGYPGKELLDDLFTRVDEVNTISEERTPAWSHGLTENHPHLVLTEDRDNADYIYERKSLVELVGQSLHKKLAHALHFAEDHPDRVLVPSQIAKVSDMVEVLDTWAEGRDLVEDYKATVLAIQNQVDLALRGVVLYTGDKPVAFTLGEEDGSSRFIIHFEKAIGGLRGVYQYINRAFAAEMPERVTEINREQDLGIPGLRQAKLTYKPSRLLMKYRIRKEQ
jgi:hypothetical protein